MFFLHAFGTMGAGDVKLFAAIGAINGISLVLPTLTGSGAHGLGVCHLQNDLLASHADDHAWCLSVFYGLLPGQRVPRIEVPADRTYTLPYAVPICFGSLIAFFLFRA